MLLEVGLIPKYAYFIAVLNLVKIIVLGNNGQWSEASPAPLGIRMSSTIS